LTVSQREVSAEKLNDAEGQPGEDASTDVTKGLENEGAIEQTDDGDSKKYNVRSLSKSLAESLGLMIQSSLIPNPTSQSPSNIDGERN
jgi:hypothetical protein